MSLDAYKAIKNYLKDLTDGVGVEVGSERGGGSTAALNAMCIDHGISFYSVDVDLEQHKVAEAILGNRAILGRGEEVLFTLGDISFAYLDAFDWLYDEAACKPLHKQEEFYRKQILRYRELGYELANLNSQVCHLRLARAIVENATPNCVIVIDDTWLRDDGTFDGKGGAAVPYLLAEGFDVSPGVSMFLEPKEASTVLLRGDL